MYALKMIREDGGSLTENYGRIFYRPGERVQADGNGIYASVSGELDAAGQGERIALLSDLEGPTGAEAPAGVVCYRSARVVAVVERGEQWRAYKAACNAARQAHNAACKPALRAYDDAHEPAWLAYVAACKPARLAYDVACKPARLAHAAVCVAAWLAYEAACEPARLAYEAACEAARRAYKAACDAARLAYEADLGVAWQRLLADVVAEAGVPDGQARS